VNGISRERYDLHNVIRATIRHKLQNVAHRKSSIQSQFVRKILSVWRTFRAYLIECLVNGAVLQGFPSGLLGLQLAGQVEICILGERGQAWQHSFKNQ